MKDLRIPALVMLALMVGFLALLGASAHALPPHVASHFDASGHADGWTDRPRFLLLMGGVGLLFPVLFGVLFAVIRFAPTLLTAPAGQLSSSSLPGVTFAYLLRRSFWFGSMTLCFAASVLALLIEANASSPARLQTVLLIIVLAAFTLGVTFWSVSLLYYFSRGRRPVQPIGSQPAS